MRLSSPSLKAALAAVAELAARFGYLARAAVYFSVGGIALLAASGHTARAEGTLGALETWGRLPLGIFLLWGLGLGLYGFAGWRALQALIDVDELGVKPSALLKRAGKAMGAIAYAAMAISVFGLLDALEDLNEPDDQARTRAFIASVLDWPGGEWAVMAGGLALLVSAGANIWTAVFGHHTRELDCDDQVGRVAAGLARGGYAARGVAMLPLGVLTIIAGWHARASEAPSMGAALESLKALPFGHAVLGVVGLGLIGFGGFGVVKARYREIKPQG